MVPGVPEATIPGSGVISESSWDYRMPNADEKVGMPYFNFCATTHARAQPRTRSSWNSR